MSNDTKALTWPPEIALGNPVAIELVDVLESWKNGERTSQQDLRELRDRICSVPEYEAFGDMLAPFITMRHDGMRAMALKQVAIMSTTFVQALKPTDYDDVSNNKD